MLDHFLVYQRSWILVTTFLILVFNGLTHLSGQSTPWMDGLTILVSLGFSLYNGLFLTNWHHVSDRLVREVQRLRSRQNFPSMPSKEVWFRHKLTSSIGVIMGLVVALIGLVSILTQVRV